MDETSGGDPRLREETMSPANALGPVDHLDSDLDPVAVGI
jgi:hypothetical protein